MRHRPVSLLISTGAIGLVLMVLNSRPGLRAQAGGAAGAKIDYSRDIQPVLEKSCYSCHGAKMQMAGLRLDLKSAAMAGGQSGAVILPGKAAERARYRRIAGGGDQRRRPMG